MGDGKSVLDKILGMTGIFKMERQRWPFHAAELQSFALRLGRPMDLSLFHRLAFASPSPDELLIDFILLPEGGLALRGQVEVRQNPEGSEGDSFSFEDKFVFLGREPVEEKSYCGL